MTVELRPPRTDELAEISELANRVSGELFGQRDETETTVGLWLTAPELDREHDIRVAVSDGALVGYADISPHPEPKFWLDLRIPMSAGSEVRDALIAWGEARARTRGAALIRAFAYEQDEPEKQALERHGYELIRHSYRMRIDFDADPPAPEWPAGITVRSARETEHEAVFETHMETFEDSWEHAREPYEEWSHWMVEDGLDLSLWFVAEEAGDHVGVALCKPHDTEQGVGWVGVLGVRRQARRKGLGRALLLHVFNEFRRRDFHGVGLGVDAESLTGANRLYENAGMRIERRSDIYEKTLA